MSVPKVKTSDIAARRNTTIMASPTKVNPDDLELLSDKIKDADDKAVTMLLQKTPLLVHAQTKHGFTPLYLAAMKPERMNCLRAILKHTPPIDEKGDDKETPLYIAVFNNNIDAVRTLIAAGAKVNEINGIDGETALGCAARL